MTIARKLITILFLLLLVSCDLTPAGEYFNRARDLEIEGNYKKANVLLNKAIAKNPKFRPALLNRAVNKSILKDYQGAIDDYHKLLEFDPDNALALLNLGNNFKRLENYDKAISSYNKALQTNWVVKPEPLNNLLKQDIEISFQKKFDQDSDYEISELEVTYERGIAYILNHQFENGINDLKKVLNDESYTANCYYWIGNAFIGLKDSTNACHNYIESAKLGFKGARDKIKNHCLKNKY